MKTGLWVVCVALALMVAPVASRSVCAADQGSIKTVNSSMKILFPDKRFIMQYVTTVRLQKNVPAPGVPAWERELTLRTGIKITQMFMAENRNPESDAPDKVRISRPDGSTMGVDELMGESRGAAAAPAGGPASSITVGGTNGGFFVGGGSIPHSVSKASEAYPYHASGCPAIPASYGY